MNKLETLTTALEARNDEILGYQINIDNYARAIAEIDAHYAETSGMAEFRTRLVELLESSKIEQLKAIIIRDVIADQLNEMETA